ncbi:unnamed protein product [Closterium sp. NIES-53]
MSIPSSHSPAITASHIADSHGLTASLSVPASPPVTDSQCCAFHGTFSAAARSQRNENRFADAHSFSSCRSRPFDSGTPRWRVRLTVRCGAAGNAGRHAAPCSARVAAEAASGRRWGICGGEGGSRGGGGRGGAGGMQARAVRCAAVGGAVAEGAAAGRVAEETVLEVRRVSFQPHGSDSWLLTDVSLSLPKNSLGLIFGRSGGGKTTLLQLLSGLTTATHGTIAMPTTSPPSLSASSPASLSPNPPALTPLSRAELSERVGIVFQFPERYFLTDSVLAELTFGWPSRVEDIPLRQALAARVQAALIAVGLMGVALDTNPRALSGGNQRRLALAIQLVRMPELLLLDEPLAGLDWRARADVVRLLAALKRERSILVVSHDLRELAPLVDRSWRMQMGGRLREESLPAAVSDDEGDLNFPWRA